MCSLFVFVAFVSFVVSGVGSGASWNADSNIGLRFEVLYIFLFENALLLKVLRDFSLALKNNLMWFKKYCFSIIVYTFIKTLWFSSKISWLIISIF